MNLAEHPQAIDLMKRLNAVDGEEKVIPVIAFMPAMGRVEGALREGGIPGLFILTSKVEIKGEKVQGMMDFAFTADKPIVIIHPNLTQEAGKSRIMQ